MLAERFFTCVALCALLTTLAACNDSSSDEASSAAGPSVDSSVPHTVAVDDAAAVSYTHLIPRRDGLVFQVIGESDYYGFNDDTAIPDRAEAEHAVGTIAGLYT